MKDEYFNPISQYENALHIFDAVGIADHGKFGSIHTYLKLV